MSIKKDLVSGIFFTAISKYSGIIVSLVISGVLARLLSPEEFGVVGVATVIIVFFNILGDIGIGPAIIQRDNLNNSDLKSIHTFTTLIGVFLALCFFCSSWIIAKFYNNESLLYICQLLSISIIFNCFGIVPQNLQYKAKNFKRIAFITLGIQITIGVLSIIFAYFGGGVYALVFSQLGSSLLTSLTYNWYSKIAFSIHIHINSLRKIASFSIYQLLFNIVTYFSRNLDKILVGKYIGLSQLGYYEKSYRLMLMPLQNISFVIAPVLLPVFSDIKDNVSIVAEKYSKLLYLLSFIAFPIGAVLFFCAKEIILLIFGNQWGPSIYPFQILTFTVGVQILTSTAGSIYQVVDATKQLLFSGCIGAFFMICSFALSILNFGTIEAVCYGYLLAQIANTIQTFYLIFRILGLKKENCLKIFIRPILIVVLMYISIAIIINLLPVSSLFIGLLYKIAVSLIIYLILIQSFGPINLIDVLRGRISIKNIIN